MKHPKTYFILPTTAYKPDDYIRLGQVIVDPRKPFARLAEPLPLHGALEPRILPTVDWSGTKTHTGDSSMSIFAHAVNMLTAEASTSQACNESQTWNAATLETQYFELSADTTYIERTAKQETVERWMKKHRHLGKTLYMITGLKIARNPGKATYSGSDKSGLAAKLNATLEPGQHVHTGAEVSRDLSAATSFEGIPGAAYVFAYRLRKLRVTWRRTLSLSDYAPGADLYSAGDKGLDMVSGPGLESGDDMFEMANVSIEKDDFGASLPAKDKKYRGIDEDEGATCLVVKAVCE